MIQRELCGKISSPHHGRRRPDPSSLLPSVFIPNPVLKIIRLDEHVSHDPLSPSLAPPPAPPRLPKGLIEFLFPPESDKWLPFCVAAWAAVVVFTLFLKGSWPTCSPGRARSCQSDGAQSSSPLSTALSFQNFGAPVRWRPPSASARNIAYAFLGLLFCMGCCLLLGLSPARQR